MFSASKSKIKDKRAGKESQMTTSKASGHVNAGSGSGSRPVSGYAPLLGKFHALDVSADETDDEIGPLFEYNEIFNNGEYEDTKDKTFNQVRRPESVPVTDHDKGEKIRQKNEKKHQRQKERRSQDLYEKCCSFLMSRKLETLAQQLVAMGFSCDRATMSLISTNGKIEQSVAWLLETSEESDQPKLNNGNLKIDISEELTKIADMGVRHNCSKQDVERAVIACEGDLDYAAETLRRLNPSPPLKSEETLQKPSPQLESEETLAVAKNSLRGKETLSVPQNSLRGKETLAVAQNWRAKETLAVTQNWRPKETFAVAQNWRPKETLAVSQNSLRDGETLAVAQNSQRAEETLAVVPNSMKADPRQDRKEEKDFNYAKAAPVSNVTLPKEECAKPITAHGPLENDELKNLQFGSVKQQPELVLAVQRPQSSNLDHAASGLPQTNNNNEYTDDVPYQDYRQFDGLINHSHVGRTLSAASSLGIFIGLRHSNSSSTGSSPVDWHFGDPMYECDYTNVDWSLERGGSSDLKMSGMRVSQNNYQHYNEGFDTQASKKKTVASDGQFDRVINSVVKALFGNDDSSYNRLVAGAGAGQIGEVVNSGVEALYTGAGSSWDWSGGGGAGQIGRVINSVVDEALYTGDGSSYNWLMAGDGAGQIGGVDNSGVDALYTSAGADGSCNWSAAGAGIGGYNEWSSAGVGGYNEWSSAGAGAGGYGDWSSAGAGVGGYSEWTSAGAGAGVGGYSEWSSADAGAGGYSKWSSAGAGVGGYSEWTSAGAGVGGYSEWSSADAGAGGYSKGSSADADAGAGGYSKWSSAEAGADGYSKWSSAEAGADGYSKWSSAEAGESSAGAGAGPVAGAGDYMEYWSSPFEGKDLFSDSRQLVSSPSLQNLWHQKRGISAQHI